MALTTKHCLLDADEEHALAMRYHRTRDPADANKLVAANLRLVLKIASASCRDRRAIPDLFQEGCVGLVVAIQRFDPTRGVRLATYATWWIRSYVFSAIRQIGRVVSPGNTRQSRASFIAGERALPDVSLNTPAGPTDSRESPLTLLPGPEEQRPDRIAEAEDDQRYRSSLVARFTESLDPRERDVFLNRWLDERRPSLAELGRKHGVSRERARQIECDVLRRLRKAVALAQGPDGTTAAPTPGHS